MSKIAWDIGGRKIGAGHPVFIIAELSANHLQDYRVAEKTVRAMKEAGADAVKFQTFRPDTITLDSNTSAFRIRHKTLWDGKTLYQLYQGAYMPWEWQPKLERLARQLGLVCFSSPFDKTAVDFLEGMNTPAYKVASFEITDIPLIEYIASKKKPVIISTGVAGLADIEEAVKACLKFGNGKIALLKCTSAYPAPLEEMNLSAIPLLEKKFKNAVIGLSDHTMGLSVPTASVALGAKIIEKHFILNRKLGGPDSAFSSEPREFAEMVQNVRAVEKALGKPSLELNGKAAESRHFCRSLFAVRDIPQGEVFTADNVRSIRPGSGLHPRYLEKILGKKSLRTVKRGTPFQWAFVTKRRQES